MSFLSAPRGWFCVVVVCALAGGCSSRSNTVAPVITVTLAESTAAITPGQTSTVTATVANDAANAGVIWSLSGPGSLTAVTKTTVVYNAPAAVAGAIDPVIVATSVSDALRTASIGVTVTGTPLISPVRVFPAQTNVAYSLTIQMAGGTANYTWTQTAGTLPPGLTLGTSTTTSIVISGTPTQVGTFPISLQVADSTGLTSSVSFTITIVPQYACLLSGNSYVFELVGYEVDKPVVRGGRITVAEDGTVSGVEDFGEEPSTTHVANSIVGSCTTTAENYGVLTLSGNGITAIYNYAMFDSLTAGRLQENDNTTIDVSGRLQLQAPGATGAPAPTGAFAFDLGGDNGSGSHIGIAGNATMAAGTISSGRADAAGALTLTAGQVAGSFSAADTNGRGTGTLTVGSSSFPIIYYAQAPGSFFILSVPATSGSPTLSGYVTEQTGGPFTAASFSNPGILELWGVIAGTANTGPEAVTSLVRLSGANATAGHVDVALDQTTRQPLTININPALTTTITQDYPGSTLTVDPDGRADVVASAATNPRHFVVYLSGPSTGYAVSQGTTTGDYGIFEMQDPTIFPLSIGPTAVFVAATENGGRQTPITLLPQLSVTPSAMSANSISVTHAADLSTGRGTGIASTTYFGGTTVYYYIIDENRIVLMGDGTGIGSGIIWLQH